MESTQKATQYAKKLGHKFLEHYLNHIVSGDIDKVLDMYVPEAVLTRSSGQKEERVFTGIEVCISM